MCLAIVCCAEVCYSQSVVAQSATPVSYGDTVASTRITKEQEPLTNYPSATAVSTDNTTRSTKEQEPLTHYPSAPADDVTGKTVTPLRIAKAPGGKRPQFWT